jgi:hypothetical protein
MTHSFANTEIGFLVVNPTKAGFPQLLEIVDSQSELRAIRNTPPEYPADVTRRKTRI